MVVLAILLSTAGCRSDEQRYYVLSPGEPNAVGSTSATIGVGPFEFPEYLNRLEIVERRGRTRVEVRSDHLWAEPLSASFTKAMVENLRRLLGTERVVQHPWNTRLTPEVVIEARVARFDIDEDGTVVLRVSWTLSAGDELVVHASELSVRAKDDSVKAATEAMSQALLSFSEEVATRVRSAHTSSPEP